MGRENVRPSCYVSVEMDATDMKADIYYGKFVRLFEVHATNSDLRDSESSRCAGSYKLAMIKWAAGMISGAQGQVYKVGSRSSVFGRYTVEDVSVVQRLIGVVEHLVPTGRTLTNNARRRRKTYFLDDFQRIDHLLSPTRASDDGVNRRLRGMARER